MNIAIPELQEELSTDVATVTWVINAYNIVFAILLVSMGRLADQFGRKRFFMLGLTVFTIGSGLCAAAWSVEWLMAFRVIQGIGAGILAPLGFAITVLVFPPEQRGRGLALIAVVALVSSALGPVLGGVLIEIASWHWIFLINIPIGHRRRGARAALVARDLGPQRRPRGGRARHAPARRRRALPHGRARGGQPLRRAPGALAEPDAGGDPARRRVLLVGAARAEPDDHPGPARRTSQFRNANIGMLFFAAGAIGSLLLLSLVFTNLWGYEPIEAGLALLPVPLCGLLVWPFVGRAADTRPPGRDRQAGADRRWRSGCSGSRSCRRPRTDAWTYIRILPGLAMIGVGMGIGFPALNVGAMGAVAGPGGGPGLGRAQHRATARRGDRRRDPRGHLRRRPPRAHVLVRRRADRGRRGRVGDPRAARRPGDPVDAPRLHRAAARDRFEPEPGFDEEIIRQTAGSAREGFAWAFRQAALLILSVLPLLGALTRTPAQARAEFMAAQAARPPSDSAGLLELGGDLRGCGGLAARGKARLDQLHQPRRGLLGALALGVQLELRRRAAPRRGRTRP